MKSFQKCVTTWTTIHKWKLAQVEESAARQIYCIRIVCTNEQLSEYPLLTC